MSAVGRDAPRSRVALLAERDPNVVRELSALLGLAGWHVVAAGDDDEVLAVCEATTPDVMFVDQTFLRHTVGESLHRLRAKDAGAGMIVIGGGLDEGWAVESLRSGAEIVLRKPLDGDLVLSVADLVLEHVALRRAVRTPGVVRGDLTLAAAERAHILRVLQMTRGNRARAAELLQISRQTLYNRLAEWAL